MRAMITMAAVLMLGAAAPAFSQGRGPAPAAPVQSPSLPASSPHAFKAPAGSLLILRDGRPKWEVYNDCSWAYYDEVQKAYAESKRLDAAAKQQEAEEAARRAAQEDPATMSVTYNSWMDFASADTGREALDMSQKALDLKTVSSKFSDLAIDAYVAQTGTPRAQADAFMREAKAVASLSMDSCKILLPSG